jgi:hypothetical protein
MYSKIQEKALKSNKKLHEVKPEGNIKNVFLESINVSKKNLLQKLDCFSFFSS